MEIAIPFGSERKTLTLALPPENVVLAQSKNPAASQSWRDAVRAVIRKPIGVPPIHATHLRGKRVVIIADDWARPTPAYEVIPLILDELKPTGVERRDITFIAASGMHDPMSRDELTRKLGAEIVRDYRCIVHDAGKPEDVVFLGITPNGTPVWVNRCVAEADYTIGISRICPHETHGYEGGYKLILPGVSGYDTIARNHSLNCAADYSGTPDSPSRRDANDVGALVGIDFLINGVTKHEGQLFGVFCGDPMAVYRRGVEFGDREIWGAEVGKPADIVVASPGSASVGNFSWNSRSDLLMFTRIARVAKEGGTVIFLARQETSFDVTPGSQMADDAAIERLDRHEFTKALADLAFSEVVRLHEKRTWPLSAREVMWRMRMLRDEFLRRRRIEEIGKRRVIVTPDPDRAVRAALSATGSTEVRIIVLPEAATTLAKEKLYRAPENG